MKRITRERPKIDRVACPWLIANAAIPYDVPGVELTHEEPLCSFDALLKKSTLLPEQGKIKAAANSQSVLKRADPGCRGTIPK